MPMCVRSVRFTSADAASQFAAEGVNLGKLLPLCERAGAQVRRRGDGRGLLLLWGAGGGQRRGGGGGSRGLGGVGGRGAAGRRLGLAGRGTGQVEAPDPGRDRRVEGELPRPHRGGGAGGDGQRRRRGELPAEAGRFVVHVLGASVVLVGGEEQLQGPGRRRRRVIRWRRRRRTHWIVDGLLCKIFLVDYSSRSQWLVVLMLRMHKVGKHGVECIAVYQRNFKRQASFLHLV